MATVSNAEGKKSFAMPIDVEDEVSALPSSPLQHHWESVTLESISCPKRTLGRNLTIILTFCAIVFMVFAGFGIAKSVLYNNSMNASQSETATPTTTPTEYPAPTTTTENPTEAIVTDHTVTDHTVTDPPCNPNAGNRTYLPSSSQHNGRGRLGVPIPPYAQEGDLLVLFMSRTDDVLPLELDGWETGPSCLKSHNGQKKCWTLEDCLHISESNNGMKYCSLFPRNHTGLDLATVVFYRTVLHKDTVDDTILRWSLPGNKAAWAIIVAIPGADNSNPIRSTLGTSCDKSAASVFPSVHGEPGDLLLLSMAFDDATDPDNFQAPNGTVRIDHVHGSDEAGFLYGQRLTGSGNTSAYQTEGEGGPRCKDELLSVAIRMLPSNDTDNNFDGTNILPLLENDPCLGT